MTADDLRAIAGRHAWDTRQLGPRRARLTPDDAEDAHKDRGALLALVRRVAEMDPFDDCDVCWCGEASPDHTPDCLWLICQGVRE